MSVLVVSEHDNRTLAPSTLTTVSAATKINQPIDLLIAGHDCSAVAQNAINVAKIQNILVADAPQYAHHLAENVTNLIVGMAKDYSHILAPATSFGKNFMPRVAALLDVAQISDVIEILDERTFVRPIYAGNAQTIIQSRDSIKVITTRSTAFDPISCDGKQIPINTITVGPTDARVKFIEQTTPPLERPELTSAKIVVSGGRGIGSTDNFKLLEQLADKLGAAIGASRAAVDAGYVPNSYQVGQTGKIVAPDLYIAVGISGAIQHLAGMKESKVIVAINKDPDSPIFQIADYWLVGDLFELVPQLIAELDNAT